MQMRSEPDNQIRLFPLFFHNGCSQSSRFPTAGQGERSSGNEIVDRVDFTIVATAHCETIRNVAFLLLCNIVRGPAFLSIEQRDKASN